MALEELSGQTMVTINPSQLTAGTDYELNFESFDSLTSQKSTLATDTILLHVKAHEVPAQVLTAGVPETWPLPVYYDERESLESVKLNIDASYASFINYDSQAFQIVYDGGE